ncbi:MAG: hypothetical protein A2Y12_15575 [Planctomycetes bacterium GWF2_42_9]|nr:MAG: hypothetical protein A2Y12_15575 [Planctomycetes bacterium GWF2_42_9]
MFYRSLWTLILVVIVFVAVGAQAAVIGYDGFENHTVGTPLFDSIEIEGQMPDIGTEWMLSWVQQNKTSYVTSDVAYSGTQAQSLRRVPGSGQGLFTGFGTGVSINVDHQYVFSGYTMRANDTYAADNAGSAFFSAGPSSATGAVENWLGGWNYNGNATLNGTTLDVLQVRNGASYTNVIPGNAYKMIAGDWYKFEMIVSIGARDNTTGLRPLTYDAYFTDVTAGGSRTLVASSFNGASKLSDAGIAHGWEINTGATAVGSGNSWNQVYFDDLKITEVPEPATVSLLGLGGIALIRRFRK